MNKFNYLSFFFLFVLIGCANTYKLEKKSILNFNESYYSLWSSGVKGGGSGFSIYLMMDKNSNLDKKDVKIQGIYFKEKYTTLKYQELGKYQAFIKADSNSDKLELESNIKDEKVEVKNEKIPFVLKDNEAVVSYLIKEKLKYVKIELTKKKTMDFPM